MAANDLTITTTAVIPAAGFEAAYSHLAGAAITIGEVVYLDASSQWQKADTNVSDIVAGSSDFGIALNSTAAAGQPLAVMKTGNLAMGAILTKGTVYCVSVNVGKICPQSDLTTGDRITQLGRATSASVLQLERKFTGITL
jgi:hypothetical protein